MSRSTDHCPFPSLMTGGYSAGGFNQNYAKTSSINMFPQLVWELDSGYLLVSKHRPRKSLFVRWNSSTNPCLPGSMLNHHTCRLVDRDSAQISPAAIPDHPGAHLWNGPCLWVFTLAVCVYTYIYIYTRACVYVHMYITLYIYIYIYICIYHKYT